MVLLATKGVVFPRLGVSQKQILVSIQMREGGQ
jgi:hypothetical protein